jgi:hypothetical protein
MPKALVVNKENVVPKETYYLLIVDASSSMSPLTKSTISGVNEQIDSIKQLEKEFPEQKYNMSLLFHESRHNIDHLSSPVSEGTCKVQVLRSCGPWSAAIPAETSIQQCWINLIKHSEKFVYIENQFFILLRNGFLNSDSSES